MTEQDKQSLLARRDALRERLEAIEKDYREGLDANAEEQAVQLENAEVLQGIARATAEELAQVEQQLADMD